MYNYLESVKSDVLDYIASEYSVDEIRENLEDRDTWAERLNDDL